MRLTSDERRAALPADPRLHEIARSKAFASTLEHARDAAASHDVSDWNALRISAAFVDPRAHGGIDREVDGFEQHFSRSGRARRYAVRSESRRIGNTGRASREQKPMIGNRHDVR